MWESIMEKMAPQVSLEGEVKEEGNSSQKEPETRAQK